VPLVTFQFCHRGIRHRSCARSVIEYTKDPVGWQSELAIGAANSGTSTKIMRARELLRNPCASSGLHACSRRAKRRIRSSDRYCPDTWI
jgi:hypothetical protein